MKTTLKRIRKHEPCSDSWENLLRHLGKTEADNEDLELKTILDLLGVQDAIWALRSIKGIDKEIRLFACDCAESVLHIFEKKYPNDNRPRKSIEVSRLFAEGKATREDLKAAWDAGDADRAAAWAADRAADWDARADEKQKQKELFIKYFC